MRLPTTDNPEINRKLVELNRELENIKRDYLSAIRANRAIHLIAPDGDVFEVTVSDVGVLVTTKVSTG